MGTFLLGFIIAWALCHRYTHIMIAGECEHLGRFFVGGKTYKCVAVETKATDTSTPQVIIDAERRSQDEVQ